MNIAFQILTPGINFDLARAGKGKSAGWFFFSCYNSEKANTLLEVNASQKDKDFIIHCGGGYRSMTAASILKSRGWENFKEVEGGFDEIKLTRVPKTDAVCTKKTNNISSY